MRSVAYRVDFRNFDADDIAKASQPAGIQNAVAGIER
jgi:hypothetical protein